jgi:hypothetical protein
MRSSVSYQLSTNFSGWSPFITHININGTNDCIAYINKLAGMDTNNSLIISASVTEYGNTNYYFDDTENGYGGLGAGLAAEQGVIENGVSSNSVVYTNVYPDCGSLACHITSGTNVAGYLSWGAHSSLGPNYAINQTVQWFGNSSWWIIETVESFNGQRYRTNQGNFTEWFSQNAFAGVNYSNTPVGAVSHTDEPGSAYAVNDETIYFGDWAAGDNFGMCAWNSRVTPHFQAVGDPLVVR